MKIRHYFFIALAVVTIALASCKTDPTQLTPQQITQLYNEKAAELCMDKVYTQIDTGYYELNDTDQRYVLQKLAHAGVIEYNVERFAWFNKCTDTKYTLLKKVQYYCQDSGDLDHEQNVYGRGEVISYELEEHFMVKVKIKSEYKSMLVDAIPEPSVEDKDLEAPLYKEWEEDMLENNENWPEMIAPDLPTVPLERKDIKCRPKKEPTKPKAVVKKTPSPKKVSAPVERKPRCVAMDQDMLRRYEEAKAAEVKVTAYILAYEFSAVKARNIQLFQKDDYSRAARCEVIVKSANVTPQGHILLQNVIDGIPCVLKLNLTYYEDKGWVIDADEREVRTEVKDKRGRKKTVTTKVCEFPEPKIDPSNVTKVAAEEEEE